MRNNSLFRIEVHCSSALAAVLCKLPHFHPTQNWRVLFELFIRLMEKYLWTNNPGLLTRSSINDALTYVNNFIARCPNRCALGTAVHFKSSFGYLSWSRN